MTEKRKLNALLRIGAYYEALESARDVSNGEIVLRVLDLQGRYPELHELLGKAQTALTERRDAYDKAIEAFRAIDLKLKQQFGPQVWSLALHFSERPTALKVWLWALVERHLVATDAEENPGIPFSGILSEATTALGSISESLPSLGIDENMLRQGSTTQAFAKEDCRKCKGTHRLELKGAVAAREILHNPRVQTIVRGSENGHIVLQMLELWRREYPRDAAEQYGGIAPWLIPGLFGEARRYGMPDVRLYVEGLSISVPCDDCVKDYEFMIPKRVRPGWLLKAKRAEMFVRVKHLTFRAKIARLVGYGANLEETPLEEMPIGELETPVRVISSSPPSGTAPDIVAQADAAAKGATPVGAVPRVGRNDPCPCGSGKKYKHCCGR